MLLARIFFIASTIFPGHIFAKTPIGNMNMQRWTPPVLWRWIRFCNGWRATSATTMSIISIQEFLFIAWWRQWKICPNCKIQLLLLGIQLKYGVAFNSNFGMRIKIKWLGWGRFEHFGFRSELQNNSQFKIRNPQLVSLENNYLENKKMIYIGKYNVLRIDRET